MKSLLRIAGADPATRDDAARLAADALLVDAAGAVRLGAGPPRRPPLYVAIGDLGDDGVADRVAEAVAARPRGVLLARTADMADVEHLSALLAVAEARAGLEDGAVRVVACIGDARGALGLTRFVTADPRLQALAWDAGGLAAGLGAVSPREADGRWIEPLAHVRSLLLTTAAALGLPAIDTACGGDHARFVAEAEAARRHGFRAKIATSSAEVAALGNL